MMDVFGIAYRQFLPPPTSDDASRRGYVRREETEGLGLCIPKTFSHVQITPVARVNSVF